MNFLDEIDIDIVSFMNILFIVDMHWVVEVLQYVTIIFLSAELS
jgi:hypothetical protein